MDTKDTNTESADTADVNVRPRGRRARRAIRALAATLLATMALLGLGGGTAQAWPWDGAVADVTAFVSNVCGPEDVAVPVTHDGWDGNLGLNSAESVTRGTVIPVVPAGTATDPAGAMDRIDSAYKATGDLSHANVANPSYARYGFSTLRWDSYGGGCMDATRYATPMANGTYQMLVIVPTAATMWASKMALDPWIAKVFSLIVQPVVGVFTSLFVPWIYIIAGFGALFAFVKHRGSWTKMIAQGAWIFGIVGTFLWLGTPGTTQSLNTTATNLVTNFGKQAEKTMLALDNQGRACTVVDSDRVLGESIWYTVAYRTWLVGEVGDEQARRDGESCGTVGMGDALLNGHYVADDADGRKVLAAVTTWNAGSYAPKADTGTKMHQWTAGTVAQKVPFLAAVAVACNDPIAGGASDSPDRNLWAYGGQCDSGTVGTTAAMSALAGKNFDQRLVISFAGGLAALCIFLTVALVAGYVLVQKMNFFFLLLFGPAFLTIAVFGDEKRRGFATKYFEQLAANIAKQVMGVFTILFVGYATTNALSPALGIPWLARPFVVLLFFFALLMFSIPLKKILTAGVKGDSDFVRRTAQKATVGHGAKKGAETAVKAAKTAAKGVALAGAFTASGGTAALAGVAGAAKAGGVSGLGTAAKGLLTNPAALKGAAGALGHKSGLGRSIRSGVRAGEAMHRATAGLRLPEAATTGLAAAAGARVAGGAPASPTPVSAVGTDTAPTPAALKAAKNRANGLADGPGFGGGMPVGVEGALTPGADVLAAHDMTRAEAVREPERLVQDVYGGRVTAMSPLHPATPALTRMTMAAAARDVDAFEAAHGEAQALIEAHGVPEAIKAPLHAVGDTAVSYDGADVAAVAATVTPSMEHGERAEAVVTLGRLAAGMPADAPERPAVEALVTTLGDVSAPMTEVMEARESALAALPPTVPKDIGEAMTARRTEQPITSVMTVEAPSTHAVEAPAAERVDAGPGVPAHIETRHVETHGGTDIPPLPAPARVEAPRAEPVTVPEQERVEATPAPPVYVAAAGRAEGTDIPAPTRRDPTTDTRPAREAAEGDRQVLVQAPDEPEETRVYRHRPRRRIGTIYESESGEGTSESSPLDPEQQ
mgnify:CR=1 FL=1